MELKNGTEKLDEKLDRLMRLDKLSELINRIDNHCCALNLDIPDNIHYDVLKLHYDAIKSALPDVRDELKSIYLEMGGENHWK